MTRTLNHRDGKKWVFFKTQNNLLSSFYNKETFIYINLYPFVYKIYNFEDKSFVTVNDVLAMSK